MDKPSYVATTARPEIIRWSSRHDHLRAHHPRDRLALSAHLLQQAAEEMIDAEDALAHCLDIDARALVGAAFEVGRERYRQREQALSDAACICAQCDQFRKASEEREADRTPISDDSG